MCGLVGLAGDCTIRNKDVFTDLLYIDTLRGGHSTGAAIVKRDKHETILAKLPCPGHIFIETETYKKALDTTGVKALVGHNRYATIGAKTALNAHPFDFDGVVGAHNGTIEKWSQQQLDAWDTFGTDSEAIYYNINKNGLKETVSRLYGAWALTYVDKKLGTMNMLRNDKRPLFYAYSLDLQTLYWASEAEMLAWIVQRNKIKFFENRIFECEPDIHYQWYMPEFLNGQFKKPMATKVEGCKWTYTAANPGKSANEELYGASNAWYMEGGKADEQFEFRGGQAFGASTVGGGSQQTSSTATKKHTPKSSAVQPPEKPRAKVDTHSFRPPYKDYKGNVVDKKDFFSLVHSGCVYCDDADKVEPYKWGDFIHILKPDMDNRKIFLCEPCYNDDDVRDLVESSI